MKINKRTVFFLILFILIAILIAAFIFLDIEFVKTSSPEREGLGFDTMEESASLRQKLDEQGVDYTIQENEDGVKILWNKEDNKTNELTNSGLLQEGYTGLCFQSLEKSMADSLIEKLKASNIGFSVRESENEYCVNWPENRDLDVQEIYPGLKQIRELQRK